MLTEVLNIAASAWKVIKFLTEVKSIKKHNTLIAQEIDQFIASLTENVELLKQQPPKKGGSWAIAIDRDLKEAASNLFDNLNNGNFRKFWDAKKTKDTLESLRRDLMNKIQLSLQLAALEVTIDTNGKVDNFMPDLVKIFSASSSQSRSETMASIRTIIQPLVVAMKGQDCKIEDINSIFRGQETKVETSTELEKFLQDVLTSLDELADTELDPFEDPFTKELMTDPVKCFDGITYDRFSVFRHNMTQLTPLVIACDDLDVRSRLFKKFDGMESKFQDLRTTYRDDALKLARNGHSAEALSMLINVLQWAPQDEESRKQKAELEQEIAEYNRTTELGQKMKSARHSRVFAGATLRKCLKALPMLKNVLHWAPQDEESRKQKAELEQEIAQYNRTTELGQKMKSVDIDQLPEGSKSFHNDLRSQNATVDVNSGPNVSEFDVGQIIRGNRELVQRYKKANFGFTRGSDRWNEWIREFSLPDLYRLDFPLGRPIQFWNWQFYRPRWYPEEYPLGCFDVLENNPFPDVLGIYSPHFEGNVLGNYSAHNLGDQVIPEIAQGASLYYFEIYIKEQKKRKELIILGFYSCDYSYPSAYGRWSIGSVGNYTKGETVGVGFDFAKNSCFHTRNGRLVGATTYGKPPEIRIRPFMCLSDSDGARVIFNNYPYSRGKDFLFKIDSMM